MAVIEVIIVCRFVSSYAISQDFNYPSTVLHPTTQLMVYGDWLCHWKALAVYEFGMLVLIITELPPFLFPSVYANSLLATLNSREAIRAAGAMTSNSFRLSDMESNPIRSGSVRCSIVQWSFLITLILIIASFRRSRWEHSGVRSWCEMGLMMCWTSAEFDFRFSFWRQHNPQHKTRVIKKKNTTTWWTVRYRIRTWGGSKEGLLKKRPGSISFLQ